MGEQRQGDYDPNRRFWPTARAYVEPVREQLREAGALTYVTPACETNAERLRRREREDAEVAALVAAKPRNHFNAERGEPCRVCASVGMVVDPATGRRGLCPGCHGAGCGPAKRPGESR